MFTLLFIFMACFIVGAAAITFSVLAWRTRTEGWFYAGLALSAIMLIIIAMNIQLLLLLIRQPDMAIYAVAVFACFIVPICFLVASRVKPRYGAGTEITDDYVGGSSGNSGEVTPEYLDEIINSPDEEIKFE